MYNGVLYYNIAEADGGIYAVGLDDITQREKIYSGYVASIHILDSEWIYFTDESNALSRITHDGDIVERILDKNCLHCSLLDLHLARRRYKTAVLRQDTPTIIRAPASVKDNSGTASIVLGYLSLE